jgi:hypothetical protein
MVTDRFRMAGAIAMLEAKRERPCDISISNRRANTIELRQFTQTLPTQSPCPLVIREWHATAGARRTRQKFEAHPADRTEAVIGFDNQPTSGATRRDWQSQQGLRCIPKQLKR